jgi:hypothetical protein
VPGDTGDPENEGAVRHVADAAERVTLGPGGVARKAFKGRNCAFRDTASQSL